MRGKTSSIFEIVHKITNFINIIIIGLQIFVTQYLNENVKYINKGYRIPCSIT